MKQQIDDIARVYAESLFQLAEKAGGMTLVQTIGAEFAALADAVTSDRRFAEFLKTPVIDAKTREASLKRARGWKRREIEEGIASMRFLIGQYEAELASMEGA